MRWNSPLVRAWYLKESFQLFWTYRQPWRAKQHLLKWMNSAMRSRLEPFKKFVGMLRSHLDGVLAWTKTRLSNGAVEGMNNKIKSISHRSFGFRTAENFIAAIYHLWQAQDTTIYRIPQRSTSLAHVVPESAIVRHALAGPDDMAELERYVTALDDPALPAADFEWKSRNRIHIRADVHQGQGLSVQISYHPGWHARARSRQLEVGRDQLGLMWVRTGICRAVRYRARVQRRLGTPHLPLGKCAVDFVITCHFAFEAQVRRESDVRWRLLLI